MDDVIVSCDIINIETLYDYGDFPNDLAGIEKMTHSFVIIDDKENIPIYAYPFRANISNGTLEYETMPEFLGFVFNSKLVTKRNIPFYKTSAQNFIDIYGGPVFGLPNIDGATMEVIECGEQSDKYTYMVNDIIHKPYMILIVTKDCKLVRTTIMYHSVDTFYITYDNEGNKIERFMLDEVYLYMKYKSSKRTLN